MTADAESEFGGESVVEVDVIENDVANPDDESTADLDQADESSALGDAEIPDETASPADVGRPRATGDLRVDDALARLDDLDSAPTAEHVVIFDDVHRRLQSALTDLEPDATSGA